MGLKKSRRWKKCENNLFGFTQNERFSGTYNFYRGRPVIEASLSDIVICSRLETRWQWLSHSSCMWKVRFFRLLWKQARVKLDTITIEGDKNLSNRLGFELVRHEMAAGIGRKDYWHLFGSRILCYACVMSNRLWDSTQFHHRVVHLSSIFSILREKDRDVVRHSGDLIRDNLVSIRIYGWKNIVCEYENVFSPIYSLFQVSDPNTVESFYVIG